MNDQAYQSLVSLLASGAKIPPADVDRICLAAGQTAGGLIGDVQRQLDVVPVCDCGRKMRVYCVRQRSDGRKTQYLRCESCGRRMKKVRTTV